jgi:hypothetical protein
MGKANVHLPVPRKLLDSIREQKGKKPITSKQETLEWPVDSNFKLF